MRFRLTPNAVLGALALLLALLVALAWVPLDTDSGLILRVRRQVSIGDALAPVVAAAVIGLGGVLLLTAERAVPRQERLTPGNLRFLAAALGLTVLGLLVIRHAGPALLGAEQYRLQRDTLPWRVLGYMLGGSLMISGLIALVEHRLTWRAVAIGVLATAALVALYDLPFDDLLLPPNGDV